MPLVAEATSIDPDIRAAALLFAAACIINRQGRDAKTSVAMLELFIRRGADFDVEIEVYDPVGRN